MPKYEGKQNFRVSLKSKAMSVEREREEEERAKVSVNNGQYIHLNQHLY